MTTVTHEHIKVNNKQVYMVTTDRNEGETIVTLGYATGDPEDIKNFYEDKRGYTLGVIPLTLNVIDISKETLEKKLAYLRLKKELKDLEGKLGD